MMRNSNLIRRQKRHMTAYLLCTMLSQANGVVTVMTMKALHHAEAYHRAWRARHEFKRRPREAT